MRPLLILMAIVLVVGASYLLLAQFSGEPRQPAVGEEAIAVTAEELTEAYRKDPAAADKRFKDRFLEVSGEVMGVDNYGRKDSLHVMLLPELSVNCFVPERNLAEFQGILPEDKAIIRGICIGKHPTAKILIVQLRHSSLVRVERARQK